MKINNADADDVAGLRGDEEHDRELICRWWAESYGEEDEEYHR